MVAGDDARVHRRRRQRGEHAGRGGRWVDPAEEGRVAVSHRVGEDVAQGGRHELLEVLAPLGQRQGQQPLAQLVGQRLPDVSRGELGQIVGDPVHQRVAGAAEGLRVVHGESRSRNARSGAAAALGVLVPDEVPGALDHAPARCRAARARSGARRRAGRTRRARPRRAAPARPGRRAGSRRASRSRPSGTARARCGGGRRRRGPSSTRRSRRRRSPRWTRAAPPRSPARSRPPSACSPTSGVRSALAMPCHLPSGKKPLELITRPATASGCSHAQRRPISAAPVVRHQDAALHAVLGAERLERLDLALPGPGRVERRVAEAGQVGGEPAPARRGQRRRARRATCTRTAGSRVRAARPGRRRARPRGRRGSRRHRYPARSAW